ncbi:MAG TPA: S8 family serine peptidase, partial [Anaerolineales bacterium]|nr:S8 family serine peptidase [Anaerolineales bacterium]
MAPNPPTNPSPARPIGCLLILLVLALICGSLFWPNPVTLDDIEIPAAKSFTCEPLSSSSSAGPALTLAPSGLWYQDAVILTGQPADVQRVAAQALGVEQPFAATGLVGLARFNPTQQQPDIAPALQRYSQLALALYSTGQSNGQPRPPVAAVQAVLQTSLDLYTAGEISEPVFADLNYVTGFPEVTGSPWSISGSPWGVEAQPWSISGSPWSISGSPWSISGSPFESDADKLARYQVTAERTYWTQWPLQADAGLGVYSSGPYRRQTPADGAGTRVVIFDTSPYVNEGLQTETRAQMQVNLCSHLVPMPANDAPADATGYMRDHGLFAAGLTYAVAPESELHLVRVLDDNAVGDLFTLVKGISEFTVAAATTNGGRLNGYVYNFSLGLKRDPATLPVELLDLNQKLVDEMIARGQTPPELLDGLPLLSLEAPLNSARALGAVLVAAAGNDSADLNPALTENAPASFDNVLGVQSTNLDRDRSCYANTGEAGAPGAD